MADAEEPLEIFNDNFESIGVASRSEVHRKGLWHKTFNCWIVARENGREYLLLQLRGPDKAWFPNKLDITSGGHIRAGETAEESTRELKEELGIEARLSDLIFLGVKADPTISGEIINREFCMTYLLEVDKPLIDYNFQLDEVAGLYRIEISNGIKLLSGETDAIDAEALVVESGKKRLAHRTVTKADFAPLVDNYYLKVFILAKRYFSGEKHNLLVI